MGTSSNEDENVDRTEDLPDFDMKTPNTPSPAPTQTLTGNGNRGQGTATDTYQ